MDFSWMKKVEDDEVMLFSRLLISGVLENIESIDQSISKHLSHWTIDRINKVDLAILRTGIYSLLFQKDIPPGVSINEAVEISKEFGADDSYKFINAVMDGVRKSML